MSAFRFEPCVIPDHYTPLRAEVRAFLAEAGRAWTPERRALTWTAFDRDFSRELGRRGWVGMCFPKAYGGHERSALERYIVMEECLAAGAPVGAHWFADRQSGPLLLKVGTEAQRQRFLPAIARGELAFCIGLSEPGAGSDLAAVRSRATRVDGGWRVEGRKLWTTNAQHCDWMIALLRTGGPAETERQRGLTQFLIDMRAPGVSVRPIRDMSLGEHFNEILFDNVLVADDLRLGPEGEGWAQVNAELAFERSGPDRILSSFLLLPALIDAIGTAGGADRLAARRVGEALAELIVLREMSLSVQGLLERGESPLQEAAVTKILGVGFEQRLPALVREVLDCAPSHPSDDALGAMLAQLTLTVPSFSLRGGTTEIMRGIVARGMGLR